MLHVNKSKNFSLTNSTTSATSEEELVHELVFPFFSPPYYFGTMKHEDVGEPRDPRSNPDSVAHLLPS